MCYEYRRQEFFTKLSAGAQRIQKKTRSTRKNWLDTMKHDLQEKTTRQEAEELAADESEWSRRVAQGPTSRQHSITKAQIEIIIKAAKRTCMSGNKTFIFCWSLFDTYVSRRPRDALSKSSTSLILNRTRKIHLEVLLTPFSKFHSWSKKMRNLASISDHRRL